MTTTTKRKTKAIALAKHLGVEAEDVTEAFRSKTTFEVDGETWLVLTDEEADEHASNEIRESLWAFNPSFLLAHINAHLDQKHLSKIQSDMCENANEVIAALVGENIESLIDDAISSDGREHFLSRYDGIEVELAEGLFAYRID